MEIEISFVFFVVFVVNLREQLLYMGGERQNEKYALSLWQSAFIFHAKTLAAACGRVSTLPQAFAL